MWAPCGRKNGAPAPFPVVRGPPTTRLACAIVLSANTVGTASGSYSSTRPPVPSASAAGYNSPGLGWAPVTMRHKTEKWERSYGSTVRPYSTDLRQVEYTSISILISYHRRSQYPTLGGQSLTTIVIGRWCSRTWKKREDNGGWFQGCWKRRE